MPTEQDNNNSQGQLSQTGDPATGPARTLEGYTRSCTLVSRFQAGQIQEPDFVEETR